MDFGICLKRQVPQIHYFPSLFSKWALLRGTSPQFPHLQNQTQVSVNFISAREAPGICSADVGCIIPKNQLVHSRVLLFEKYV